MQFGQGTMTMQRNASCLVTLTGMTVTGIEEAPRNGRVELAGGTYSYFPNREFTGTDRFSVTYNLAGHRVVNVVDVHVLP
jgi:hypothetical protein